MAETTRGQQKTLFIFAACLIVTAVLSSCTFRTSKSGTSGQSNAQSASVDLNSGNWLTSGSIVLSSPVPAAQRVSQIKLLGFLPSSLSQKTMWLSISRTENNVSLMQGTEPVYIVQAEGLQSLQPGAYSLQHKQIVAPWYAPDAYFTARCLPVPAEGDKTRFRRGALGEFALFLDQNTPIHSGLIWTNEIGGIKLAEGDAQKLYSALEVGAPIEIQ